MIIHRDFNNNTGYLYRGGGRHGEKADEGRGGRCPDLASRWFLASLGVRAAGVALHRTEGCFFAFAGAGRGVGEWSEDYSACNCPAISRLSATQNLSPPFPFLRQLLSDITFLSERKTHKYSSSPDNHISSHHDNDDEDDDKLPRIASAAGISSTTITIVGKNQDAFYNLKPRRP